MKFSLTSTCAALLAATAFACGGLETDESGEFEAVTEDAICNGCEPPPPVQRPNLISVINSVLCTGSITYTVRNTGSAAAGGFWVHLYPDVTFKSNIPHYVNGLAAGASASFTDGLVSPRELQVYADATFTVRESRETDNDIRAFCP